MVAQKNKEPTGLDVNIWNNPGGINPGMRPTYTSPRGSLGIEETMVMKPYINSFVTKTSKSVKVLRFLSKWGRNAGPLGIVYNIYRLHKGGVKYWMKVRKAAKAGRAVLEYIDEIEKIAVALDDAADLQYSAYVELPSHPLRAGGGAGLVTAAEMEYVEIYFNSAHMIANEAMTTRTYLQRTISGWDNVLEQANQNSNFTRKSAWEAITMLEMRFSKKGGTVREFLVKARDRANLVESGARDRAYLAGHILGKPIPDYYHPPEHTID